MSEISIPVPEPKVITTMSKPKSPHKIVVSVDPTMNTDGDEWFLRFATVKKKSGEVISNSCIIAKDLPDWIRSHEGMGWTIDKKEGEQHP